MRRPRSTACTTIRDDPFAAADPALRRRSSPMAAAIPWSPRTRRWARGSACRSTTRSTRRRIIPCRPIRASRAISASSAIVCRTARRAWTSSSSARRDSCPDADFCWAAPAGATSRRRANVRYFDHVYTRDHNAFNCTPRAVLNISRESMARYGFSPATRVFEAAGAGACLITDAWKASSYSSSPGARCWWRSDGEEVAELLRSLTPRARARNWAAAACRRVLAEHTYAHRAAQVEAVLEGKLASGAAR